MSARARDQACRVLVGSEWLVCGISYAAACEYVENAGARGADMTSPFGACHHGPVLTRTGEVDMTIALPTVGPFVIAPVDARDAALLGLAASQGGETR